MTGAVDKNREQRGTGIGILALLVGGIVALFPWSLMAADADASDSSSDCQYEKTYHTNGKLKSSVGRAENPDGKMVLHCKTVVYFENGKLAMEQEFKNGIPHGIYRTYYDNGKPEVEFSYSSGTPDGPIRSWHRNGQLKAEGTLKEGLRNGVWTSWHEDGRMESEGEYQMDKKVGVWSYQNTDGSTNLNLDHSDGVETKE